MRVPFGTTRIVRLRADAPGTYLYWASTTGKPLASRNGLDSQLSGALVVDPAAPHAPAADRVFVIGQWINANTKGGTPDFRYELDVINGRSWPHTERLSYAKNSTVRWRLVNSAPEVTRCTCTAFISASDREAME